MTSAEWVEQASGWTARAAAVCLRGDYRENNEDYVHIDPKYPFALVLDGMGGQVAGEIASQEGAKAVASALRRGLKAGEKPRELIEKAIRAGHDTVLALGQIDRDLRNCGTTLVLALMSGGVAHVSWLGDSPAYRVSGGHIEKLTWEHDMRNALVRAGVISAAEAREHRIRNVLWRYLGSSEAQEKLEIPSFAPRPGDRLLLVTDGVTAVLTEEDLLEHCRSHPDPQTCAEKLANLALERGSRDNCTCAVIAFEWSGAGSPPAPQQQPRPAPRQWWQFWK